VDIRGRVTVWNVETGLEVARLNHWGKGTSRNWLTFSGDGRHLAAGNSVAVSVWNLAAADERLDLVGHPAAIPCLAFSPDGSLLVSGGKDAVVNFWNPKTGERLGEVAVPAQIQSLAFSQDSSLLAVGYWTTPGQENQLSLLDPATRRVLAESPSHIGNVNGVAFYDTPEGRFLAVGGNSGLSLWSVRRDAENGGVQLNLEETEPVEYSLHLAASRNGNWVVWNRDRIEVALWDVRQGIIKPLQAPRMHQGWHGLAVFPDSERVIYVNNEGVAEVWNLVQDRPAFQMGGAGEFKTPHVALSRDGRRFAALVDTDVVSVWDTQTQRILYRFRPEEASVWSLAWGRDGQDLAVGRNDGGLAIWKLDRLEQKLQKMGLGSGSGAGNLPKEPAP
jgi:WD40 repeat protein